MRDLHITIPAELIERMDAWRKRGKYEVLSRSAALRVLLGRALNQDAAGAPGAAGGDAGGGP